MTLKERRIYLLMFWTRDTKSLRTDAVLLVTQESKLPENLMNFKVAISWLLVREDQREMKENSFLDRTRINAILSSK